MQLVIYPRRLAESPPIIQPLVRKEVAEVEGEQRIARGRREELAWHTVVRWWWWEPWPKETSLVIIRPSYVAGDQGESPLHQPPPKANVLEKENSGRPHARLPQQNALSGRNEHPHELAGPRKLKPEPKECAQGTNSRAGSAHSIQNQEVKNGANGPEKRKLAGPRKPGQLP